MSRGSDELLRKWTRQQQEMAGLVVAVDDVPWSLDAAEPGKRLQRVAGLDISFVDAPTEPPTDAMAGCARREGRGRDEGGVHVAQGTTEAAECGAAADGDDEEQAAAGGAAGPGVAALVVLSFPDMKLLYEDYEPVDLTIPYLPGYLGFREVDAYARLLRRVEHSPHRPQVLLVDGCGVLHPRGCGSACQVGVTCGYPAVGVAKNLLVVDGLDRFQVRRELQVATAAAAATAATATAATTAATAVAGGSCSAGTKPPAAAAICPAATATAVLEEGAAAAAAAPTAAAAAVIRKEAALIKGPHTQARQEGASARSSSCAPASLGSRRENVPRGNAAQKTAESHGDGGGPGVGSGTVSTSDSRGGSGGGGSDGSGSGSGGGDGGRRGDEGGGGNITTAPAQVPLGDYAVAAAASADAALGHLGARGARAAGGCAAVRDVRVPLVGDSGRTHGVALCPGVTKKPLYVSVGHRLSLDTAVELVRLCCLHRIPEPVRQADLRSRAWLRRHLAASGPAGTG